MRKVRLDKKNGKGIGSSNGSGGLTKTNDKKSHLIEVLYRCGVRHDVLMKMKYEEIRGRL